MNAPVDKQQVNHSNSNIVRGDFTVACPSCCSHNNTVLGKLPRAMHFCSFYYNHSVNNSNLYECKECGLWYRNPCLSSDLLDELYSQQPESTWELCEGGRVDFDEVYDSIKIHINDDGEKDISLLDIGCFNGELINYLRSKNEIPKVKEYFGIEPSQKASEKCKSNNIKIIGSSYLDLSGYHEKFDIITVVDVFEHILDTNRFINTIARNVDENGLLIVITGATDSDSFSTLKNYYYYPSMPEHVAFVSKKHAEWLGLQCSMKVVDYKLFDRRAVKPPFVKTFIQNLMFLFVQIFPERLLRGSNKVIRKISSYKSKGIVMNGKNPDHAIVTFKKIHF